MIKRALALAAAAAALALALVAPGAALAQEQASAGDWTSFQNSATNNGVTANPGPTSPSLVRSLWDDVKFDSPVSAPIIVGDKAYAASGKKLFELDATTGAVLRTSQDLSGAAQNLCQPVYDDGVLYVVTSSGGVSVEAVNASTFQLLWRSNQPVPGDAYSPLTYHEIGGKGYLYTGTVSNGDNNGTYFCVDAEDGTVLWQKTVTGGFYWAGAYATDSCVVFGSQTNAYGSGERGAALYSVNPLTGEVISSAENLLGSIRNTPVYSEGYLYFGTKGSRFYRIALSDSGVLAQRPADNECTADFSFIDLPSESRAAAVVYKGRAYVGAGALGDEKNSCYLVLDASQPLSSRSEIYRVSLPGSPTGSPVLSVADEGLTGAVRLYFTCNCYDGGLYAFNDNAQQTKAPQLETLFLPTSKEHTTSSLAISPQGVIYYHNDSRHLFAVASSLVRSVSASCAGGSVSWTNGYFQYGKGSYALSATEGATSLSVEVTTSQQDVALSYLVNGVAVDSLSALPFNSSGVVAVTVTATRGALQESYTFKVTRTPSNVTTLSTLFLGTSATASNRLPKLSTASEYKTAYLGTTLPGNFLLRVKPTSGKATVKVYAESNVLNPYTKATMAAGKELICNAIAKDGTFEYLVRSSKLTYDTALKVQVKAGDGKTVRTYRVVLVRTKPVKLAKATGLKAKQGAKVKSKRYVTFSWKRVSKATGYQVVFFKNTKLSSKKATVKVKGGKTLKKKIKLTKGKRYVRVRAYAVSGGKTYYGSYSKAIKLVVK